VGAIKELMLTHETRGFGWKIRHPIKNYRENATVESLTKRLVSDKHFTRTQIANEFLRDSDSFAMDWGKGLSNDRDAIRFARENRQSFKPAEPMLRGVLKANYNDQIKDAAPQQNESDLRMKSELQKVFDERAKKEKIVIHEGSEVNKTAQKTAAPVTSQKSREARKDL
jgi:hypothetical protein